MLCPRSGPAGPHYHCGMTDQSEDREEDNTDETSEHAADQGNAARTSAAPPTEAIILKSSD